MPPTERVDVAIVGAGAAGLSAGAALRRRGVESVLLDRDDRIGGTWARRYERLHLHTIRRFSGLAHHGIPRGYGRYLAKDAYARYLEEYAARMELDVRLGHAVRRVAPVDGGWAVDTDRGAWRSRVVVVATGHYSVPTLPRWPGLDEFAGRVVHSGDYRAGDDLAGSRALVVGIGNSGAEIAADLVERGAAHVAISVRTPPPIVPRELFGLVPVQVFGILCTPLPPRLVDRVGARLRRLGTGDLSRYGIGEAAWGPFTARRPAVIDVGFLRELRAGRVVVRPPVARFTQTGVVFADDREEEFDAVVAATGFATGLEEFLDVPEAYDESGQPRYRSGRRTPFPGLYFIGFDETVRGHLFEARRESLRLAREVGRYLERAPTPA